MRARRRPRQLAPSRERRGAALLLVLGVMMAVVAMAASATVLAGSGRLLARYHERQRDLQYAADLALAIGRSRVIRNPALVRDSGYATLLAGNTLTDAYGQAVPRLTVSAWAAGTGSIGRMATIVAEARDSNGARVVRRLDLAQESYSQFAYWSNVESNSGTALQFGGGERFAGAVWSNDTIRVAPTGAAFLGPVATSKVMTGKTYATLARGVLEGQPQMRLPLASDLASKFQSYAAAGNLSFTSANTLNEANVYFRMAFVAVDLNGDGDSTDVDEGFVRVYRSASTSAIDYARWIRADYGVYNCGDWHPVVPGGPLKFFPAYVHGASWAQSLYSNGGMTSSQANSEANKSFDQIMQGPGARCFLGGANQLAAVERMGVSGYSTSAQQKGGDDTTFTASGAGGEWLRWPGAVDARLAAWHPWDAAYLFPLSKALNPASNGVIHVSGSVAVSGVLRGQITVYAGGFAVVVDDLRYATDPGSPTSPDALGIVSAKDIVVADNAFNTPQSIGGVYKSLDETVDLHVHGALMALGNSFRVQNYASGPLTTFPCSGTAAGRGCLYLTGGLVQSIPGFAGTASGAGFRKRYVFDRRLLSAPPPRFPTTGRIAEDRITDVDARRFDPASYFAALR
jgi:hypothetical protein